MAIKNLVMAIGLASSALSMSCEKEESRILGSRILGTVDGAKRKKEFTCFLDETKNKIRVLGYGKVVSIVDTYSYKVNIKLETHRNIDKIIEVLEGTKKCIDLYLDYSRDHMME